MIRALAHLLVALACFLGTASGLRTLVPWPAELGLGAKLTYFENHKDEFDVLFLGSSRVYRGIVPRLMQDELREKGVSLRIFNLGVGGMEDFEADHVLREVLAMKPAKLRWLFIEPGRWDPRPDDFGNTLTLRTVEWHTLEGTRNALEALFVLDLPAEEMLGEVRRHLTLCAMRASSYGQGIEIVRRVREVQEDPIASAMEQKALGGNLGFVAMGDEDPNLDEAAWARLVRTATRNESKGRDPGPNSLASFPEATVRRQIALAEANVENVVYLGLPSSRGAVFARAMDALDMLPAYLAYDLPTRYPDLYAFELRADANHFNERGARKLTRRLARDLAPLFGAGE